ncbi:hypothetical protein [Kitasatospora sp. NBC_01300]|uniref:hypothetical protein n=1 Tax=Kitasatospora sp. NBC_01300 TaxID=2903574 RepID=UPI002F915A07|nr:hypothetical protein OG556_00005 [Kitasatospora sp. NBC_01300]WSK08426.1 hypothetical protein OG556_33710 [Kitasatospora sp. NBC_01300]WSK08862.1 hypothetical protein OG556_33715 [Kitasatospora sp. NBC_01300]WSK09960.1 hypothetical protein OG556_39860 [Kitasatospora sp. NBC_01300]
MSDEAAPVDGGTMYAVDVGSEPLRPLGMQAWAVEGQRAQVVFAASHRVETFALAGGRGPDSHLAGLASGGWARFGDFEGWAEPAVGWSAVLDVAGNVQDGDRPGWRLLLRGRSEQLARLAPYRAPPRCLLRPGWLHHRPLGHRGGAAAGEMYALLCPVVLV